MNKIKSLTRTFLVTIFAFAMLFAGMVFVIPQKTIAIYATGVGATPTAMTKNGVNFYPVFDSSNPLPSGVTFYTSNGSGGFTQITSSLSSLSMDDIGSAINVASNKTLYYTSTNNTPIKCIATVESSWDNIFTVSGETYPCYASALQTGFINSYLANGVTTPYFTSQGALDTTGNWNFQNEMESPTINGVEIDGSFELSYSSFVDTTNVWSSRASNSNCAYYYDSKMFTWEIGMRDSIFSAVLLCDFGKTIVEYNMTYNANNATSGSVPTDANSYAENAQVTVLGNTGSLARTGYSFVGWNTKDDGTGTDYAVGASYTMGTANVTLYAKWLPTHTCNSITFNPLTSAFTGGQLTNGDYYLYENITLSSVITIPSENTVNLCLNGKVLNLSTYVIVNNGTLNICDCCDTAHYFNYSKTANWTINTTADAGIEMSAITSETTNGAIIKLNGGVITGGKGYKLNAFSVLGGAIYNSGVLSVKSSIICGNDIYTSYSGLERNGGGIYSSGELTIDDCVICGNCSSSGGGVSCKNDQSSTITNSDISFNRAHTYGALELVGADTTIENCSLISNRANSISCVDISSAEVVISDSTIKSNIALTNSLYGCISIFNNGEVTLDNCSVIDNSGEYGIYHDPQITSILTDVTITGNTGGVCLEENCSISISGKIIIKDNLISNIQKNIIPTKSEQITIGTDGLDENSVIRVLCNSVPYVATSNGTSGDEDYFISDVDAFRSSLSSGKVCFISRINAQPSKSNNLTVGLNMSGLSYDAPTNYKWTKSPTKVAGFEVFNAYGVTYNSDNDIITINSTYFMLSSTDIKYDANVPDFDYISFTTNDNIDEDGFEKDGNTYKFTPEDEGWDFNICLNGEGTSFTLKNFKLVKAGEDTTETTATLNNGTVGDSYYCTITFADGSKTISDVVAFAQRYYVTYNLNNATSGSVPTDSKAYFEGDEITVLGNTGSLEKNGYSFAGWNTKDDCTGTNYTANATFSMGTANVTLYAKWTAITHTCNSITFNPLTKSFTGGTISEGNYYLCEDVTLIISSLIIQSGYTINLCLNGYILNLYGHNIQNNGTLNIYDCSSKAHTISSKTYYGGVITGGSGCGITIGSDTGNEVMVGGAIYNKGTLNIYGGNIVGNSAKLGGAIFTDKDTTLTLKNCNITSNIASENGGGIYVCNQSTSIYDSNCFAKGTLIAMANGTTKNVEDIVEGDLVKTFNHETGLISSETVCLAYKGETAGYSFTLHFTNDMDLSIVGCHDLFEQSSLKYVTISNGNVNDYIGKYFYNANSNIWEQLLSVTYNTEKTEYYSIYTAHQFNCIANDMLTAPDDIDYFLNIFEFDNNLIINQAQKQADIEEYGLMSYDETSKYITEEYYDNFNVKYHNIAIGKGLKTHEEMLQLCLETKEYINEKTQKTSLKKALLGVPLIALDLGNENTFTITIGTGAIITNNFVDNSIVTNQINNIYLTENCFIEIENGSTGFGIGITLENTTGTFVCNAVNNSDLQYFSSDNTNYYTKYRDIAGTPTTYSYNIEEKYTVTYNLNSGTGTLPVNTNKYFKDDVFATAVQGNIIRTGYTFGGWSDGTNIYQAGTNYTVVTANITLSAVWTLITYNITYNLDNGINGSNPSTYNIETATITLADPTKIGYKFLGWYENAGFTGSAITQIAQGTTGDKTFYTKWEECTNHTWDSTTHKCTQCNIQGYIVIYDDNVVDNSVLNMPEDSNTYIENSSITISTETPTRDGYVFKGWSLTANGDILTTPNTTMGDSDLVLYAQWIKIIVTEPIKTNDYTVEVDSSLTDVNYQWLKGECSWKDATTVGLYYCNFGNGRTLDTNSVLVSSHFFLKVNDGITLLRFKYTGTGTITNCSFTDGYYYPTYDALEYHKYFDVQIENKGDDDLLTDIEAYVVTYTTLASEKNARLGTISLENVPYCCVVTLLGGDSATSAIITPKAVSFAGGDGVTGTAPTTQYQLEGRAITLPSNTFTRVGYKFLGWNTNKDDVTILDNYIMGDSNVTLYAIWQEKTTVTITETTQTYLYETQNAKFEILGTSLTNFSVKYKRGTTTYTTAPDRIGYYDVVIHRDESADYKEFNLTISNGFGIYCKVTYLKGDATSGDAPIDSNKYYNDEFGYTILSNANMQRTGYKFAGWKDQTDTFGIIYNEGYEFTYGLRNYTFIPIWEIILNNIKKDNNYEVSYDATDLIGNSTYQWSKLTSILLDNIDQNVYSIFEDNSHNVIGIKKSNNTFGSVYESGMMAQSIILFINKNYVSKNGSISFKSSENELFNFYTFEALTKNAQGVFTVYFSQTYSTEEYYCIDISNNNGTRGFDITDFKFNKMPASIDGENGNQLQNATEDAEYYCAVTYKTMENGKEVTKTAFSNIVSPKAVSFAGGDGVTGTAPTTQYQLEGRAITLPSNTFTRVGYKFLGWNTNKDDVTILDNYIMGDSNVTLYAIWQEKTTVLIDTTTQRYTYNGQAQGFIISGNVTTGFNVMYYIDDSWTTSIPVNVESYKVKITRAEDNIYKAYEKEIVGGLLITQYTVTIVECEDDFTYNGQSQISSLTAYYYNESNTKVYLVFVQCLINGNRFPPVDFKESGEYAVLFKFNTTLEDKNYTHEIGALTKIYHIKPKEIVIDWSADNYTYNGQVQTITASYKDVDNQNVDLTVTIDSEFKNAGNYTATVSFANYETNYKLPTTFAKSYTINKFVVNEPTVVGTYKYTGKEQTVVLSGVEEYMTIATDSSDDLTQTEVGVFTINFTLDSNYQWAGGSDGKVVWKIEALSTVPQTVIICFLGGLGLLLIVLLVLFLKKKKVVVIVNEKLVKEYMFRPFQKINFNGKFRDFNLFTDRELTNTFTQQKMGFKSIVIYGKNIKPKVAKTTTNKATTSKNTKTKKVSKTTKKS